MTCRSPRAARTSREEDHRAGSSASVVVGDAKQIGPALEKFGKVEVTREKK
jgi:hypothetical protein